MYGRDFPVLDFVLEGTGAPMGVRPVEPADPRAEVRKFFNTSYRTTGFPGLPEGMTDDTELSDDQFYFAIMASLCYKLQEVDLTEINAKFDNVFAWVVENMPSQYQVMFIRMAATTMRLPLTMSDLSDESKASLERIKPFILS